MLVSKWFANENSVRIAQLSQDFVGLAAGQKVRIVIGAQDIQFY